MTIRPLTRSKPSLIAISIIAVYLIWGSTYLALRFGLEGFPPFILNGIRFTMAGTALLAFLAFRGKLQVTRTQLWNGARVGLLMLVGGVGMVTLAEDLGIGSGVAATAVAVIPVWTGVIGGLFGDWPGRREWVGLAIGLAGVVLLAWEGDLQASPAGLALIVIAPVLWSFGSVWGTRLEVASPLANIAVQFAAAGVALTVVGLGLGERVDSAPPAIAWAAVFYLAVFGSLVAFTAYVYLLRTVRPALATSYAYVNPVVAVILGLTVGGETITGSVFFALPLILGSVALVATSGRSGLRALKIRRGRVPTPQEEAA